MAKSMVLLRSANEKSVHQALADMFTRLDYTTIIPKNCRVVIKVNLSTPDREMAPASNTSPEILQGVIELLKKQTDHIIIGESDGMRYKSEEAYEISGYAPILSRYNVRYLNFSKDEWVETEEPRIKGWPLPKTLLEADVFVTLPVLKTHATTVFTGALKNQFGCYPQYNRILLHPHLDEVLVLINRLLKPKLVIMDGIIAMEGRGPINGKPRRLDMILGSTDPVALDSTAMRLVGLDPYTSHHISMAAKEGLGRIKEDDIEVDGGLEKHKTKFEPADRDFPIRLLALLSHSKYLTEKLILSPEAFYPLRHVAMRFRDIRDFVLGRANKK